MPPYLNDILGSNGCNAIDINSSFLLVHQQSTIAQLIQSSLSPTASQAFPSTCFASYQSNLCPLVPLLDCW